MSDETQFSQAQRYYDNQEEQPEECAHHWVHVATMDGINFWLCHKCGEEFEN